MNVEPGEGGGCSPVRPTDTSGVPFQDTLDRARSGAAFAGLDGVVDETRPSEATGVPTIDGEALATAEDA